MGMRSVKPCLSPCREPRVFPRYHILVITPLTVSVEETRCSPTQSPSDGNTAVSPQKSNASCQRSGNQAHYLYFFARNPKNKPHYISLEGFEIRLSVYHGSSPTCSSNWLLHRPCSENLTESHKLNQRTEESENSIFPARFYSRLLTYDLMKPTDGSHLSCLGTPLTFYLEPA